MKANAPRWSRRSGTWIKSAPSYPLRSTGWIPPAKRPPQHWNKSARPKPNGKEIAQLTAEVGAVKRERDQAHAAAKEAQERERQARDAAADLRGQLAAAAKSTTKKTPAAKAAGTEGAAHETEKIAR